MEDGGKVREEASGNKYRITKEKDVEDDTQNEYF